MICKVITEATGGARIAEGATTGAAGVICAIDRDLQDILRLVELQCGSQGGRRRGVQQSAEAQAMTEAEFTANAISALEISQAELEANSTQFTRVLEWLTVLSTFLTGLAIAARFFPGPARLISSGATQLLKRVAGFQGAIVARKAANDATWAGLQRTIQFLKAA